MTDVSPAGPAEQPGGSSAESGIRELTLAERFPGYAKAFALGFTVTAAFGTVIGLLTDSGVVIAVGYSLLLVGAVYMLAGGATGGGYTNLGVGAVEAMFGGRRRYDEDVDDPDVRMAADSRSAYADRRRDPYERLRKGLRPQANPRAFWQVVGGVGYVAVGAVLLSFAG